MRDRIEIGLLCLAVLVMIGFAAALAMGTGGAGAAETGFHEERLEDRAGRMGGSADTPASPTAEPPRVEVLNGAGIEGLARSATRTLREQGFDVVYFGNAPSFDRTTSLVLDRGGPTAEGRIVAEALGIREMRSEPDSTLLLEATVLLGADWSADSIPPQPEARGLGPWIRRLPARFGGLFSGDEAPEDAS